MGRREESARQTRQAIVAAARQLFASDGYEATTIAVIAERAGVAVQTVYAVFGNKPSIMAAVIDQSIAGDDAPIAVNARDWMHDVWVAPTARERLSAYAAAVRRIMERAADLLIALEHASSDPELADLVATTEQRRRRGAATVIDSIREVASLRDGLRRRDAIDVLWLLNSPAVFHHFTRSAGWSAGRYERWLAETMCQQLLAPAPPGVSATDP
jgi:AcrR family transcriptional regulator